MTVISLHVDNDSKAKYLSGEIESLCQVHGIRHDSHAAVLDCRGRAAVLIGRRALKEGWPEDYRKAMEDQLRRQAKGAKAKGAKAKGAKAKGAKAKGARGPRHSGQGPH